MQRYSAWIFSCSRKRRTTSTPMLCCAFLCFFVLCCVVIVLCQVVFLCVVSGVVCVCVSLFCSSFSCLCNQPTPAGARKYTEMCVEWLFMARRVGSFSRPHRLLTCESNFLFFYSDEIVVVILFSVCPPPLPPDCTYGSVCPLIFIAKTGAATPFPPQLPSRIYVCFSFIIYIYICIFVIFSLYAPSLHPRMVICLFVNYRLPDIVDLGVDLCYVGTKTIVVCTCIYQGM